MMNKTDKKKFLKIINKHYGEFIPYSDVNEIIKDAISCKHYQSEYVNYFTVYLNDNRKVEFDIGRIKRLCWYKDDLPHRDARNGSIWIDRPAYMNNAHVKMWYKNGVCLGEAWPLPPAKEK